MPGLRRVFIHVRKYGLSHKNLYFVSLMLLFWSIFDGIMSYISPLVIVDNGFSNTLMGIIIGSSSVAGALFDFLLAKFLTNTHWRRLYLMLFAISAFFPLVLWKSSVIPVYILAMVVWGLYYDILTFGNFDFISREMKPSEHASSFGVISVFKSLGYLIAPLIVGVVIADSLDWQPFALAWVFLGIGFIFYLFLSFLNRHSKSEKGEIVKPVSFAKEVFLWRKLGKAFLPVLIFTVVLTMQDAFFWTIGPLMSETFAQLKFLDGIFLTMYTLPTLIFGWLVDGFIKKWGKKKSMFYSFGLSSLLLSGFAFTQNQVLLLVLIFFSSALTTVTWAVEGGIFANFIEEHMRMEKEVEGVEDMSVNLGYVFGPVMAGFFADKIGYFNTFALVGAIGFFTSVVVYFTTKRDLV